jgi:hypothetical protein
MKYMLLIYGEESALTEQERQDCYEESTDYAHKLAKSEKFLGAAPLQPVLTAKSVRMREGRRIVTDGPFAETHEQLGGFFMVDAASPEEAIAIASEIPGARWGTVEVRPVVELDRLP